MVKKLVEKLALPYGVDAYLYESIPREVILISSIAELQNVCQSLIEHNKKFCVRGSGTGYAGGAVPITDDTIIKLHGFDKILKVDARNRNIDVEANVTPFEVNLVAAKYGLFYPPDPASHEVCTIGGNIASNAGGPHCYMYGVTSNYVEKIKIFIPKYRTFYIIGASSPYGLAYDLKDLFIGSEGTLGVVAQARLKLRLKPPRIYTYLIDFGSYSDAIAFINEITLRRIPLAALDMSTYPFIPGKHKASDIGAKLLISIHGGDNLIAYIRSNLQELIKKYALNHLEDEGERLKRIRSEIVRQNVRTIIRETGKPQYFLFDAVVPRSRLKEILDYLYYLADKLELPLINTFHAGDGNIHPTVFFDPISDDDIEKLKAFWYATLKKVLFLEGAISGEHGIGLEKRDFMTYFEDQLIINLYYLIKSFFDPQMLLCNSKKIIIKNKNTLKKNVDQLEKIIRKYDINISESNYIISSQGNDAPSPENFSIQKLMREVLDGVIEVPSSISINYLNQILENIGYFVPYYPVIFHEKELKFLIKHNIPSLFGHIFELRDIIMGATFKYNDRKVTVGKRVLKNAVGYSLRVLLHEIEIFGEPTSYYLRVYPKPEVPQYVFIVFSIRGNDKAEEINELINKLYNYLLNIIIYKTTEDYLINIITFNDTQYINYILEYLYNKRFEYTVSYFPKIAEFQSEIFLIVGLSDIADIKTLSDIVNEFVYLITSKTLIIPLRIYDDYNKFVLKIINSSIGDKIETIRLVNNTSSLNLFLSDDLSKQNEITKQFISYLREYKDCCLENTISKNEMDNLTDFFPIKLFSINVFDNDLINEVKKCTRCGLCMSMCPLYSTTKDEALSPRGLLVMLKHGVIKGDLIVNFIQYCLHQCKEAPCEKVCPTGVSISYIIKKLNDVNSNA